VRYGPHVPGTWTVRGARLSVERLDDLQAPAVQTSSSGAARCRRRPHRTPKAARRATTQKPQAMIAQPGITE
jgi:hypothetical protein